MKEERQTRYDVLIGGGGLAGQCLARQLLARFPGLSLAVVDRLERPLPEAAFKVGESTVEIGAHYLGSVLGLESYIRERQLPKFGLRYFLGTGSLPLHERGEWGTDEPLPVPSYQLDRGRLENDLRAMNQAAGVTLHEGVDIADVAVGKDGLPHRVQLKERLNGAAFSLECRWFVDAMGRRRFLQSKLGLKKSSPHLASAVWFRVPGRLDVADLVDAGLSGWHARVPDGKRYFSTNHLMGKGYWVWLIPLGSGNTSIGIVTDERIHPYRSYATYARAILWLKCHEPHLEKVLRPYPILDFLGLRNFSYLSKRVFSKHRWACVGEAALFLDPFYSPGSDVIAMGNTMVADLIGLDRQGKLHPDAVKRYNKFLLGYAQTFLETYAQTYSVFGSPPAANEKLLWDTCLYWVWAGQVFFRGLFHQTETYPKLMKLGLKLSLLHRTVQGLFREWAALDQGPAPFRFLTPLKIPIFKHLHVDLVREKEPHRAIADMEKNLNRFEEWAQYLFYRALSRTAPEKLSLFPNRPWLNAWAITLDQSRWEANGLFRPETPPRSLSGIEEDLRVRAPSKPVTA